MTSAAYIDFDGQELYFECVTSEQAEHTATATEHNVEQGANVSDHVRPGLDRVTLELFISNTILEDMNAMYPGGIESVELDVPVMKSKAISFELEVPVFRPALSPTPGALFNAATSAIGDLISGKPSYKAQGRESAPGVEKVGAQVLKYEKANVVKDIVTLLDKWRLDGVVGKVILPWKTYESVVITKVAIKRTSATGDAAEVSLELKEVRVVESKLVTAPKPTEVRGNTAVAKGRQPTSFVRDTGPKASQLRRMTK